MMVPIFIDGNDNPIHLGVNTEHKNQIIPVCGEENPGRRTERDETDLKLKCSSCQDQLDMYRRIRKSEAPEN